MLYNFSQTALDYIIDYLFMGIGYPVIWTAELFTILGEFLFFWLFTLLMAIFLTVVLTHAKSPFYWKTIKKLPKKAVEEAFNHKVFKFFAKLYVNFFVSMPFILALLKSLSILAPTEEGMHIRDMLYEPHIAFTAFSSFVILTLCAIAIKITFYTMLGFSKSWGEFQLKMIFR